VLLPLAIAEFQADSKILIAKAKKEKAKKEKAKKVAQRGIRSAKDDDDILAAKTAGPGPRKGKFRHRKQYTSH
jgi:hypothetical protein